LKQILEQCIQQENGGERM